MNKKTMSGIISFVLVLCAAFSFQLAYAEETASTTPDTSTATSTPDTTATTSTDSTTATTTDAVATSTEPVLPPVSIHLRIEVLNQTLFNNNISVAACKPTPESATSTNGYCAVEQTDLATTWSPSSFGLFLSAIGSYNGSDGNYWGWFQSVEPGQTSLDTHALTSDEHLLLTYGVNPIKLTLSSTTIDTLSTTTISILGFGYDASYNPVFSPLASSTLNINGIATEIASTSSTIDFSTTTPGTYVFSATKTGYAPSEPVTLTVIAAAATPISTTTATSTDQTPNNTNTSNGTGYTAPKPTFNLEKAIQFLISKQQTDGSFGGALYSDWAALALASASGNTEAKQKLSSYLTANTDPGSLVTDYERRAMALMALGVNPYSGTSVDYIKKITDSFDGTQIGSPAIYNDDIFALFPLLKSGYSASDPVISKTVQFIISKQDVSGAWMGVDLTSAAIQALAHVQSISGVPEAIAKAKGYLKSQQAQGGFGTSYATSWTLQAINAVSETPEMWEQNAVSPLAFLANYQQQDGGVENISEASSNRIWATAYAIPGAQGKPWMSLLASFAKPQQTRTQAETVQTATTISTTSVISATTSRPSQAQATTTPPVISPVQKPPARIATTKPRAQASSPRKLNTESATTSVLTSATSSENQNLTPTSSPQLAAARSGFPSKPPFIVIITSIAVIALGIGIFRSKTLTK